MGNNVVLEVTIKLGLAVDAGCIPVRSISKQVFNCLTWHHAVKGNGALADEVLTNRVMVPHEETHQGQLWHLDCEHQSLLPHRVEPYRTVQRGKLSEMAGETV